MRETSDPGRAQRLLADALPLTVASVLEPEDLETMRQRLLKRTERPERAGLSWDDGRGALAVFLLVFLSTLPVVIPFLVMPDPVPALRVSNAIALCLLFLAGYSFGRLAGRRPVWMGSAMVVLGSMLVGITIALGG